VSLVDVEDPLASHELFDEAQSELLALVAAADVVGSSGDRLDSFEFESKVLSHDTLDLPLA